MLPFSKQFSLYIQTLLLLGKLQNPSSGIINKLFLKCTKHLFRIGCAHCLFTSFICKRLSLYFECLVYPLTSDVKVRLSFQQISKTFLTGIGDLIQTQI